MNTSSDMLLPWVKVSGACGIRAEAQQAVNAYRRTNANERKQAPSGAKAAIISTAPATNQQTARHPVKESMQPKSYTEESMKAFRCIALVAGIIFSLLTLSLQAETGVTANEILIGQDIDMSGTI